MTDEVFGFMLEHMNNGNIQKHPIKKEEEPRSDVDPEEAMMIFKEIIDVYAKHNISYQCACRISLALNEAMMSGAVEMMRLDHP